MAFYEDCNCRIGGVNIIKRIRKCVILGIGVLWILMHGQHTVLADTWGNAYDYYRTYQNQAVFHATTGNDGYIYCATRGVEASSGIKYRTIGWKIDIVQSGGKVLQSVYVKLGGSYLREVNSVQNGSDIYNLYAIQLNALKGRLNQNSLDAMNSGNCTIVWNACMVVMNNGAYGGTMNDYGITSGSVYTTYEGIAGAAGWSASSKEALHSYFQKSVQGLFYTVSVGAGNGIRSTSGGGRFCYGTYIVINAVPAEGYLFSHWSGSVSSTTPSLGMYVGGDTVLIANAKPKVVTVTFCRNAYASDSQIATRQFTYGSVGQRFSDNGWQKEGYHLLGWSHDKNATSAQYQITEAVSSAWINQYYPATTLYAVWEVNIYHVSFNGNGSRKGSVGTITANFEQQMQIPENQFEKPVEICTFMGFGHNKDAFDGDYHPFSMLAMRDLVKRAGVQYQNGATILLYAIWDYAPIIETGDLYYSLLDAQEGRLNEAELTSRTRVIDREDGRIVYGDHGNNSFLLKDFQAKMFTTLNGDAEIEITNVAVDHVGNQVEQPIIVHIVDTTITSGSYIFGKIRLIDEAYLENTIKKDSHWVTNEADHQLLLEVLEKANQ